MSRNAPALEKGLKIIELLMASHEPLSMSLIAEALEMKVCEIQRMIEYLAREKYIVRSVSGAYTSGPRSYAFADINRESTLISRAEGPMRRYALKHSASVHLSVLVERMLHIVYSIDGGNIVRVNVKPGLYDAEKNISGQLLLAYQIPDSENRGTTLSPNSLRERGWHGGPIHSTPTVHIVAVPLATLSNPCVAVLSSPYLPADPLDDTPRWDLIEGLQSAAAEISAFC